MSNGLWLYFIVMATALLCDWFDRFFAATAWRMDAKGATLFPDRWICWGVITNVPWEITLYGKDLRFFRMKIPFMRTWGPIWPYFIRNEGFHEGFREHWLQWIEGRSMVPENKALGWKIVPELP